MLVFGGATDGIAPIAAVKAVVPLLTALAEVRFEIVPGRPPRHAHRPRRPRHDLAGDRRVDRAVVHRPTPVKKAAPRKKAAAKKSAAKKAPAKKTPAKKSAAKKSAERRSRIGSNPTRALRLRRVALAVPLSFDGG